MSVFDIHVHLLPGIDDGPRTLDESLRTAAALVREGITHAVATPHFNDEFPHVPVAEVRERVAELQGALDDAGITLHVYAGHEVHLDDDLAVPLRNGQAATLNGTRYVLLELPTRRFPVFLEGTVGHLRMAGFVPVIAHAERYQPVWADPDLLIPYIEAGALIQITASSFTGRFGSHAQRTAEKLLRRNLGHVLASDAHALSLRPPHFAEGVQAVKALAGADRAREMTVDVPRAIVHDQPVRIPPIRESAPQGRRLFGIFARGGNRD
jgi:protein-tyrosine phosphatase